MINPFFSSLQPVVAKLGLHRSGVEEVAVVFSRFVYVIPVLLVYLFAFQSLPAAIDPYFWLVILGLALLEIPSQWFYHQALKADNISLVQPIQILLVYPLMLSFLFFDGWNWQAFSGVIVVSAGVYFLQLQKLEGKFSWPRFFEPIKSLKDNRASKNMLGAVLLWSLTTPVQKVAVEMSNAAFMGLVYALFCSAGLIIWRLIRRRKIGPMVWPPQPQKLAITGLTAGLASLGQYWALSLMNPVYVVSLKDIRIALIMLWDRVFFKTKISGHQAIATLVILVGSIMVATALL